ncbi:DUF2637 domain-containing protein [Mycolicibacterium brisbanense]
MTPTTTPTPEALRHRAAARRWALALMILFTLASMAFNVVIAARRGGAIEDLVLAGLAPAVLASMGHLLAKFVQAAIEASGVTRHVYWAGVGGVSVIGLGAFILSFENLQTLAARQHNAFVSAVFPVTLDLAILVSTGIHVVIGIANEHDQAAGVEPYRGWLARRLGWGTVTLEPRSDAEALPRPESVTRPVHTAPTALVERAVPEAMQPVHRAEQSDAELPVTWENAVPCPEPASVTEEPMQIEAPVQSFDAEAITEPMQLTAETDALPHPAEVEQTADASVQSETEERELPQPEQSPDRSRLAAVHRVVEHADGRTAVTAMHTAEAEQLRERGATSKAAPDVAAMLALADDGVSRNRIAKAIPASTHTVGKVLAARAELTEASA